MRYIKMIRNQSMASLDVILKLIYGDYKNHDSCFIDRENGGGNNLPRLFKDLNISNIIDEDNLDLEF